MTCCAEMRPTRIPHISTLPPPCAPKNRSIAVILLGKVYGGLHPVLVENRDKSNLSL